MLIKQAQLKDIQSGKISLILRKWNKPRVNKGSIIKTSIGQLEIIDIELDSPDKISSLEARLAGYKQLEDLIYDLDSRNAANLYKIKVKYHSPDPRIELRHQAKIPTAELNMILLFCP